MKKRMRILTLSTVNLASLLVTGCSPKPSDQTWQLQTNNFGGAGGSGIGSAGGGGAAISGGIGGQGGSGGSMIIEQVPNIHTNVLYVYSFEIASNVADAYFHSGVVFGIRVSREHPEYAAGELEKEAVRLHKEAKPSDPFIK